MEVHEKQVPQLRWTSKSFTISAYVSRIVYLVSMGLLEKLTNWKYETVIKKPIMPLIQYWETM